MDYCSAKIAGRWTQIFSEIEWVGSGCHAAFVKADISAMHSIGKTGLEAVILRSKERAKTHTFLSPVETTAFDRLPIVDLAGAAVNLHSVLLGTPFTESQPFAS